MTTYTIEEAGIRITGKGNTTFEAVKDAKYKMLKRHLERKTTCSFILCDGMVIYSNQRAKNSKYSKHFFRYKADGLDLEVVEVFD